MADQATEFVPKDSNIRIISGLLRINRPVAMGFDTVNTVAVASE